MEATGGSKQVNSTSPFHHDKNAGLNFHRKWNHHFLQSGFRPQESGGIRDQFKFPAFRPSVLDLHNHNHPQALLPPMKRGKLQIHGLKLSFGRTFRKLQLSPGIIPMIKGELLSLAQRGLDLSPTFVHHLLDTN